MDLTSRAGRETAEKIRKEIEALKGDALLERKNAFDQLSPPPDDEREFRQFLGSALETALKAEFGSGARQRSKLTKETAALPEGPMRQFPTSADLLAKQTTRRAGLC